jgi:hypothetical protein
VSHEGNIARRVNLGTFAGLALEAAFDGGRLTSDEGLGGLNDKDYAEVVQQSR